MYNRKVIKGALWHANALFMFYHLPFKSVVINTKNTKKYLIFFFTHFLNYDNLIIGDGNARNNIKY